MSSRVGNILFWRRKPHPQDIESSVSFVDKSPQTRAELEAFLNERDQGNNFQASNDPLIIGGEANEALAKAIEYFAPAQPVRNSSRLAARRKEMALLIASIEEQRGHVVITGARGVGKSSLILSFLSVARGSMYTTTYTCCSSTSTFSLLFRTALEKISRRFDAHNPSGHEGNFSELLSSDDLTPHSVGEILARVTGTRVIIAFDDFDRLGDMRAHNELLEVMKFLSDHGSPVHIILGGAAARVQDLLPDTAIYPRSLFSMRLSPLSDPEIEDMIADLVLASGLEVENGAVERITELSFGKSFIAKVFGLKATRIALSTNAPTVRIAHVDAAVSIYFSQLDLANSFRLEDLLRGDPLLTRVLRRVLRATREFGDYFLEDHIHLYSDGILTKADISQRLDTLRNHYFLVEDEKMSGWFRVRDANTELTFAAACGVEIS